MMTSNYNVQGSLFEEGETLTGWCWSSDRPRERLRVVLKVDGKVIAGCVASRLRPEIINEGLCDGYHGFTFQRPRNISASSLIETCELRTGLSFGRLVDLERVNIESWEDTLEAMSQTADLLSCGAGFRREVSPMIAALKASGSWLTRRPLIGLSNIQLPDGLALPYIAAPSISLIVDAVDETKRIATCITGLAPLLKFVGAEIILMDSIHSSLRSDLESLENLRYFSTGELNMAERNNKAARMAKGGIFLFLKAGDVSIVKIARLVKVIETLHVVLGASTLIAAEQAGLGERFSYLDDRSLTESCLLLATSRKTFEEIGGLEPEFEDGVYLPLVAYGLAAVNSGIVVKGLESFREVLPQLGCKAQIARKKFAECWVKRS